MALARNAGGPSPWGPHRGGHAARYVCELELN